MSGRRSIRSGALRLLLASSSAAALLIGAGTPSALAACVTITGASSGFTNPPGSTVQCVTVTAATVSGNVANAGTITPGGPNGIQILNNSTVSGTVSNSGTISATHTGIAVLSGASIVGGVFNSGEISSGRATVLVDGIVKFEGGIANSGTMVGTGIGVVSSSTFLGGIVNTGTIIAGTTTLGPSIGIAAVDTVSFGGGISNGGVISAAASAILVTSVGNFTGGITSSGTLSSGLASVLVDQVGTFQNGIVNSGTMVGTGIGVVNTTTFLGGIGNIGTIIAGTTTLGPSVGIAAVNVVTFDGGISNGGTISADASGILASGVSRFAGGISNSGAITAANGGIVLANVPSFTGNVSNSGTISAQTGIKISGSTIAGQIVDSGILSGGIKVDAASKITSAATAIAVTGPTFAGGVSSAGTISAGLAGIAVTNVTSFSGGITSTGTVASGSTAITLKNVAGFAGDISNGGTLAGPNGIVIAGSTLMGRIIDSGNILATGHGILVDGASRITTNATPAIQVTGATFLGGISNAGTISTGGLSGPVVAVGPSSGMMATFGGGIANSGTIAGGITAVSVTNIVTLTGGVTNSGNLSGSPFELKLSNISTFSGGVLNQAGGVIAATATGIGISNVSSFAGGITNLGTISGSVHGISLASVTSFVGTISNAGTIGGNAGAINIAGSTITGQIVNSGIAQGINLDAASKLTASGIAIVVNGPSFSGGVNNSGKITAGATAIAITGPTFAGGVGNTGTITAANTGILVSGVTSFSGGINNAGALNAGPAGIELINVATFTGNVGGSGSITAQTGIAIVHSTVAGAVIPGGNVLATSHGILIDSASRVTVTTGVAMQVTDATFLGGISNAGTISAGGAFGRAISIPTGVVTFTGGISNSGTISAARSLILATNIQSFSGGITNSGAMLGAQFGILLGGSDTFAGGIVNQATGSIAAATNGIIVLDTSAFAGGITNSGAITSGHTGILVVNVSTFAGAIFNSGTISGATTAIDVSGASNAITIDQTAGLIAGAIKLSANADVLNVTGGIIAGSIVGQGAANTINFALGAGTFTYGSAFGFSGIHQVNVNSGSVILNGANDASNVTVNAGLLQVGDAASPGATLTGAVDVIGGTLAGHGSVLGSVTIGNGATLAPGGSIGTLRITGPLTLQTGSTYAVQIAPGAGNNSGVTVTGNATINGGTVVVTPTGAGRYATSYVIVATTGGVSGTFAGLTVNGNFTGTMTLDYTTIPGDVLLDVNGTLGLLTLPLGASTNQANVLNGINNAVMGGSTFPQQFQNLGNLSNTALLNALTQLSGENAAGFFQGAFQAGTSFLGLMINPFLDGRFGNGGGFGAAMGFAAEEPPALPQAAAAFASAVPVKAAPAPSTFEQRFSIWGAAYGGSGRVLGDQNLGSHDTSASAAAFAAGIDYRLSSDTVVGFALAGGGTSWNVTAGLGGGSTDMFQAGAYASHHWDAAYLSAALAYNFHDVTTNRTVTIAGTDMLRARFQTNGVGARLEGGYRYATPWVGITPYAAAQVQSIALPAYGETATAGSNQFALNFASQTATTTRTELGAWLDKKMLMHNGALLTLYGRAAWAHDFGNAPSASAIFQALPGSNFIVNGAVPSRDGALVTGAAQYSLASGWSFLAKFDGEFSSTTSIYAGSGMVKKTW